MSDAINVFTPSNPQRDAGYDARAYAARQMAEYASRNRTGLCHLDKKPCARAWRCGFVTKIECCVAYVQPINQHGRRITVPVSCRYCAIRTKCRWECCRRASIQPGMLRITDSKTGKTREVASNTQGDRTPTWRESNGYMRTGVRNGERPKRHA